MKSDGQILGGIEAGVPFHRSAVDDNTAVDGGSSDSGIVARA
jgi:hypothetical protein